MPCYDKKLEAVRSVEVDTVLATHEILELFEKCKIEFQAVEECKNNLENIDGSIL